MANIKIENELRKDLEALQGFNVAKSKELDELKKEKQITDERNKALSSEVLSLRTVVVQLCKERYGLK